MLMSWYMTAAITLVLHGKYLTTVWVLYSDQNINHSKDLKREAVMQESEQ